MTPRDHFQRFSILLLTHQGVTGSIKGANFSKLSIFPHIFDLEGVSIDDFGGSIDFFNRVRPLTTISNSFRISSLATLSQRKHLGGQFLKNSLFLQKLFFDRGLNR